MARVLVDELIRHGVSRAVVSPGSRSSALALAIAERDEIDLTVHLDERSAAFRALGHAMATALPTIVVTTSGSAVANLMPAVVEADRSSVPLLLLTADRPDVLVRRRANQTMIQPGFFGSYVRRSESIAWPDEPRDSNSEWRTVAAEVFRASVGGRISPGPVHLNIAFLEPTVPTSDDGRAIGNPYQYDTEGRPSRATWLEPSDDLLKSPEVEVDFGDRPLVIAGRGDYDAGQLVGMATSKDIPVLATAQSGCRGTETVDAYHHLLVDGVPGPLRPSSVVVVGQIGPSERLQLLAGLRTPVIHVDRWGEYRDPLGTMTELLVARPEDVVRAMEPVDPEFRREWLDTSALMRSVLASLLTDSLRASGPSIARILGRTRQDVTVVGSSLAIRDVDAFSQMTSPVYSNRGLSGIDGFVSTALGIADTSSDVLAMTGDLSFLYDSNGFLADRLPALTLVVVDNNGGGLFDLLPQARHAADFERLFIAPQNRDLAKLAAFHGLGYHRIEDIDTLPAVVNGSLEVSDVVLIHVPVDRDHDIAVRTASDDAARAALSERW